MNYLDLWTDYSFMRGYMTPEQALARATKLKSSYLGVTDYCSTWGHIPVGGAAIKAGMKFVPGVTLPVVAELDKDPRHDLAAVFPRRGALESLYRLVGHAHEQMYMRPRVTWEQLSSPDMMVVAYDVCATNADLLESSGALVALRPTDSMIQRAARAGEFPLALAAAPRYAEAKHRRGFDTMEQATTLARLGETAGRVLRPVHMATAGELRTLLNVDDRVLECAMEQSDAIAHECHLTEFPRASLPPVPGTWTIEDAVRQGAVERGIPLEGRYLERVERELEVIKSKGFDPYFYFVANIVRWARTKMLVGPGRGSAGGCLVAYFLGITNVDPLVHGTLFERFIDPTRSDMPDIDVDFQDNRRDEVYHKLEDLYGSERVARLGTITKLGGKSAVNEVARFERDIPWDDKRALATQADGIGVPLSVLFDIDEVSHDIVEKHPELAAAALLEGHARHHGIHAAGICVSAEPIVRVVSVNRGVAACTLDDAETVNLLKFDALGLTTLSVIADACKGAGLDPYALQDMPMDDQAAYQVFRDDMVTGVFQFDGHTVRGLMREVDVDRFSDLPALVSLARPGPLQGGAAGAWVKRRMGIEEWTFDHPALEPITRDTYGLIVYEEQMMAILKDIAGFDVGKVNRARKAVKKKDPAMLQVFANDFIDGASGVVGPLADSLWHQIEEFGAYAFNRAHATAYGMISYQCAWLKAHHPRAFMVGLLRSCGDPEKVKLILRELRGEGIPFVSFDPQKSEYNWTMRDGVLYGGFTGLKGVGAKKALKFLEMRSEDPEGWMQKLTPAQQGLLVDSNTPWSDIDLIGKWFQEYFNDPEKFNIGGQVLRLSDIPHKKGSYVTIARIKKLMPQDQNEEKRCAKRGGRRVSGPTKFLNLILDDDGIEIGATINRYKYVDLGAPLEDDKSSIGGFYLIRGDILGGDGPKWLMLDKIRRLEIPSFEQDKPECE